MRMTHRVLAAVSAASMFAFLGGGSAGAVEGFNLRASGSGVTILFNQPGSPVPADPTGELHQAYSEARHETGPTGHALSSMLWPGSTAANAGSFFGFPNYPVRAEAFHPAGPAEKTENEGGQFTMKARSDETGTEATTTSQSVPGAPALETGSLTSSGTSSVVGDEAVAAGTAIATNITLGGVVHIDSVVTRAKAISDGVEGRVEGKTVVKGVGVPGSGLEIDGTGLGLGGNIVPVDPTPVETALAQAGITMRVARPIDEIEGANARRKMGGLIVTLAPGTAGAPAGTTITYHIATVTVSAVATQPPEEPAAVALAEPAPASEAPVAGTGTAPVATDPVTTAPPDLAPPPTTELASQPTSAPLPLPVAALPVALGVAAGVASALGGRLLGGLATGALADGVGTVCPLAKR